MATNYLNRPSSFLILIGALLASIYPGSLEAQEKLDALDQAPEVQTRLVLAGDNKKELIKAIADVPAEHRNALEFLLLNMPEHDLKNLSAEFLLSNIRMAYLARANASWKIPDDIFFNDVLPYANIDEPRDPWRQKFYELCQPMVKLHRLSA